MLGGDATKKASIRSILRNRTPEVIGQGVRAQEGSPEAFRTVFSSSWMVMSVVVVVGLVLVVVVE